MREKLNIVLVTLIRLHQSKGGIEKVMLDTANAMAQRGHNVTIVFSDKKGDEPGFHLDKNVKLINYAYEKYPFMMNGLMRNLRAISLKKEDYRRKRIMLASAAKAIQMSKIISEVPADVYITYDPRVTWMLYDQLKIRKPIVSTMHFSPEDIAKRAEFCSLRKALSCAGPIQVLLPSFVSQMRQFVPEAKEILAISNVVEPQMERAQLDAHKILNVGRVVDQKNQKLLAEAWALIKQRFPDWCVEVWGETDFNEKYTSQVNSIISSNKMADSFKLCGTTSNVKDKLQNSSIFVFPSVSEGFSLALTEAMAMGLPCIGLKSCQSVNELIRHGENGLLCDNTPESLAAAMIRLMEDKSLRLMMGRESVNRMNNYSPQIIWDQWERLLFSLVSKQSCQEK